VKQLHAVGVALLAFVACLAYAQDVPQSYTVFHPNQELRVNPLRSLTARSHDPVDVLLTSLDTVFNDRTICCGRESALEDRADSAHELSLKEIAAAVQGRHLLSDGHPIEISADLTPSSEMGTALRIVNSLRGEHAMLMVWNSHLYVLYGAIYDEAISTDSRQVSIHKLLLLDTRFSDSRREVIFNRDADDWDKVQGVLSFSVAQQ
jgi:hypothetical protein